MKKENKKFLIFLAIYIFIFLIINIIPTKKTTKNIEKITPETLSKTIKKGRPRLKLLPRIFGAIPLDFIRYNSEIKYLPNFDSDAKYTFRYRNNLRRKILYLT